MKIVTSSEMRQLEQRCADSGVTTDILMDNAGFTFASKLREILDGVSGRRIAVLIGPGNNGGDGLVAARHFLEWGALVYIYLLGERKEGDGNLEKILDRGEDVIAAATDENLSVFTDIIYSVEVVVDAVFGTGKTRAITGQYRDAFNIVRRVKKEKPGLLTFALDSPSGLDADSGSLDESAIYADYTITLGYPKVGLYRFPGAEAVGKLSVVDIGIPQHLTDSINLELLTPIAVKRILPRRPIGANKGTFGKAMIVAGSVNYIGAAYLSGSAATRVGAGLVTMAVAKSLLPVLAVRLTETTFFPLEESQYGNISALSYNSFRDYLNGYNALLIGCGIGQSRHTIEFMEQLAGDEKVRKNVSMVIDADGLNNLAKIDSWWQRFKGDVILTPHPGELSRLTSLSIEEIQQDRVMVAREYAVKWEKTLILKGAFTVIAGPDGRVNISGVANPILATAGTGDVLAGAIAGFLAQGMNLYDAARTGVYVHARAGEIFSEEIGDTGMVAGDLLPLIPRVIRELRIS